MFVGYGREKEKRKSSYVRVMGKKKKRQRIAVVCGWITGEKKGLARKVPEVTLL